MDVEQVQRKKLKEKEAEEDMSVIAFIPVRGGSKSIPLKNIKPFCGRPLVYWTARAANDAACVDRVVVATDSERIRSVAQSFGLSKLTVYDRDPANAQDGSSTESAMLEYIERAPLADDDAFILVQATSPMTTARHIDEAVALFRDRGADSLLTCSRTKRFFWNEDGTPINCDFRTRPRRQDFRGTLMENGAFYVSSVGAIRASSCLLSGHVAVYEMPEHCGLELDEPEDWPVAEALMRKYVLGAPQVADPDIRLLGMDVDGVLTDGGMYYGEGGDELKKFNTKDGKGIELVRNAGIKTAIFTSEDTALVARRAEKLKIDFLRQGVQDKLAAARELCEKLKISLDNVAYIGDDLNDIELLSHVGYAACPADAAGPVKALPGVLRLEREGGAGAVREFCERILALRGLDGKSE